MKQNNDPLLMEFGLETYTVEIDFEQIDRLVAKRLMEAIETIELLGDESDIEVWEALHTVAAYFTPPQELKEAQYRNVPFSWMKTVIEYDRRRGKLENN